MLLIISREKENDLIKDRDIYREIANRFLSLDEKENLRNVSRGNQLTIK